MNDLRDAISASYRPAETACVPGLIAEAALPHESSTAAQELARRLVVRLREKRADAGSGIKDLIQEYSLSSQEGIALMCLAEALLRIPDRPTRDALIRDKISTANWQAHVGSSPSWFVNAATWGLLITGKLTATTSEGGLTAALTRLIGKGGEPLIRQGVNMAMRMMGEQFVAGQTIDEALLNSRKMEGQGFRYSYDCLGEAATTAGDAQRYYRDYERAIHAIGRWAQPMGIPKGVYEGPGISVKLSALHPRYSRAQRSRVMSELLPRLTALAVLARRYDIALNIDAEEADRLDLSLELLEALCFDSELAGWNGIGFVIQAYQKRCRSVVDWLIDLARRSHHRLMVRLVKGAYWDSEIKRAQVDGQNGFPVFTRKVYTDISYLACARKLLSAPDAVFPQFATHNALTLATVIQMGGANFYAGQYEFQCLHGMGEPLYQEIVGVKKLNRPCRIYAPVGTHETLLAYLVRRLLENGANSSFVNRVADPDVPLDELLTDPVSDARGISPLGSAHPKIVMPSDLFGAQRRNSAGMDLSNEQQLAELEAALSRGVDSRYEAAPLIAALDPDLRMAAPHTLCNPANHGDIVGSVIDTSLPQVTAACRRAAAAAPAWAAVPATERAAMLARAADLLEAGRLHLIGLIVREAGKSIPNAIGEIREAVDFLRYYGAQARAMFEGPSVERARALGPVVCISPWNFPLAIFMGQVSAALAVGNTVLAKPAEETPLIAHVAVQILHEAGIPQEVLQYLPGGGDIGAALVADAQTRGVLFTGSTAVAKLIQRQLADRASPEGKPLPLIAETGGQNAMIVDSSALPEQVVGDVIASAFDSAGQRCSALRVLCVQEDIADRVLIMLKGAMRELCMGNPLRLSTDIGPVISADARAMIEAHVATMRDSGAPTEQLTAPVAEAAETMQGTFVMPAVIEIDDMAQLRGEVFGPVLHVLRFRRDGLDALLDAINATGYGLTFGLHTRIDETIAEVTARVHAGNLYINRNVIGAVVGVQPFGGNGLSGTGPKAGGPQYLRRLVHGSTADGARGASVPGRAVAYERFLSDHGHFAAAGQVARYVQASPVGMSVDLPGPVGERNVYTLRPRGRILALGNECAHVLAQVGAILATGNDAVIPESSPAARELATLPSDIAAHVTYVAEWQHEPDLAGVLFSGTPAGLRTVNRQVADRRGPLLIVQADDYVLDLLLQEVSISINTAAAGGNAQLMSL